MSTSYCRFTPFIRLFLYCPFLQTICQGQHGKSLKALVERLTDAICYPAWMAKVEQKKCSQKLGDAEEHFAAILSKRVLLVSGTETQRKESAMVLSNYKVGAGFAVSDMARAREFYEGKLGLSVSIDSLNNVQYRCAEDSVLHIYLSPEHVGKSTETLASWGVDDIERVVDELTRRGVTFEKYDEPGLRTDERGIATFEGDAKVAYFKDPDGHTLSIAKAPRS
jgi:catechol 2,3-dioxygenase-like lactoylglutathione lyase family enzyme